MYAQRQVDKIYEFFIVRKIQKSQLLQNIPPSIGYGGGAQKQHIANDQLLYKIFRGDTKLVRSILEANHFHHTESHEWNILWSCGSGKGYLYEGLNEYQKINHFP